MTLDSPLVQSLARGKEAARKISERLMNPNVDWLTNEPSNGSVPWVFDYLFNGRPINDPLTVEKLNNKKTTHGNRNAIKRFPEERSSRRMKEK